MSASSSSSAPWRDLFLEHVEAMKSPEFMLSTIRRVPASSSSGYGIEAGNEVKYVPRVRTCVFRGMWANLPVNPKNEAELNPDALETELPTFTTDVRMDKMPELWESLGVGEDDKDINGSGGGGPVEAVFWPHESMVQWRVRGKAYVLGPDVESSEGGKKTIDMLMSRTRKKTGAAANQGGWSFNKEVTAHFGNLSPGMRGSFKNPPCGQPIKLPVDDGLELGQKVTELHDEIARKNFRVVVIVPFEVDRTDLSDPSRARRWFYRYAADGATEPQYPGGELVDGWEKVEVWP
ncbi:pyridoxamine 5'-phosphate oxidase-domain-containing protein [Xylariales sp. AK1849]|nr:pyridoxamine 5'-phosphate oxidase-domain-containing protein [Xylariales sp. AK1849]